MNAEHAYLELFSGEKPCRSRAAAELAAAGEEGVKLVLPLLSGENWILRYRAAEVIGKSGCKTYAKELIPLLSDEKDHVRYMAVKSLGAVCGKEAADIVRPLLSDENAFVVRMVREVLAGCEKNPDAERSFSEGISLYGRQDFAAAETAFINALGENGKNPNYLCYLALCRKALGKDEEAEKIFSDVLSYLPESGFVRYEYADLLLRSGKLKAAYAEFSRILCGNEPENRCWKALSYLGCGFCHLEHGDVDSAFCAFSAAETLARDTGDTALCSRISSEIERSGI